MSEIPKNDLSKIVPPGLIERIKNILLSPATEWPKIDAEPTTVQQIYMGYVIPLAAIAPIAGFIGNSIVGHNIYGFYYHTPIVSGIVFAVVEYVLSLVGVYIVGFIINALAPTFGGQQDSLKAFKVAVYSWTPTWLAGIFGILPALGLLALVAFIYGIYLFYLGLPVLMRNPQDKTVVYTIVSIVCAAVVYIIVGAIAGIFLTMGVVGAVGPGMVR